jgi:hypothetical protein
MGLFENKPKDAWCCVYDAGFLGGGVHVLLKDGESAQKLKVVLRDWANKQSGDNDFDENDGPMLFSSKKEAEKYIASDEIPDWGVWAAFAWPGL